MGWESSDVVRFDLRPLFQGQTRITKRKSAYNLLIIGSRGLQFETNLTYRKSWAGNLLMWFDLALGPSVKVKRWFTRFNELSFWWIQFASVFQCARSSVYYYCYCKISVPC